MSVSRIQKLDIDNRGLVTGIYGLSGTNEFYVDEDLRSYYLWQELYLYLHEKGYIILFYNIADNLFSYQERDLALFLHPNTVDSNEQQHNSRQQTSQPKRHSRCRGPLGAAHPYTPAQSEDADSSTAHPCSSPADGQSNATVLQSHYPDIIVGGDLARGEFFKTKHRPSILELIDRCFRFSTGEQQRKLVVVFTTPESSEASREEYDSIWAKLHPQILAQSKANLLLRFLILYNKPNTEQLFHPAGAHEETALFYHGKFQELFAPATLFRIGRPGEDEIGNVLNKRRIEEGGLDGLFNISFEAVCRNLWQDFPARDEEGKVITNPETKKTEQLRTVAEMMPPALPKHILELTFQKLKDESGWKKLDSLLGMEDIKKKIKAYVKAFHNFKNGCDTSFNPHIALTGHPGTGKTTVARLIGEILREEGLLNHGHLVETSKSDLVGQFVGETAIKTSDVCKQAQGGVLFIDEAYQLCEENQQGGHGPDYGRESIGAMLPFMTSSSKDSVFIFAGYPDKIDYFLNNGNPGLSSRVPYIWNIEDYKPDVLYQIAMHAIGDREVTEEFRTALRMLLAFKYGMRSSQNWGNARGVKTIVENITTSYTEQQKNGPIDVDCIPEEYMCHIKDISPEEEQEILRELDELIGLDEIKSELRSLVETVKFDRAWMRQNNCVASSAENMNFLFIGNPGTGKTTVAKMIGKILYGFGLLESPEVLEAKAGKITSGNAARNMTDLFDKAIGKVLFIDEAYSLIENGSAAIDAMTGALTHEDYKGKMCVILAGYPAKIRALLATNEGMSSRFPNKIRFRDYTNEELWKVLKLMASRSTPIPTSFAEECHPYAIDYFSRISRDEFSNSREAENLLAKLENKMKSRVLSCPQTELTILPEDFDTFGRIDPSLVEIDDGTTQKSPTDRLHSLQGMEQIKQQFEDYLEKLEYSINYPQSSRFRPHIAFLGNPGTGKTTVARIFGDILREKNILKNGNFLEVKPSDFISEHVGGTEEKARDKCEEARGGVMFIDEAHKLYQPEDKLDHAQKALGVILTELESRNDTLYIFAGYSRKMQEFLDKADPGLRSRIPNIFEFEDYTPEALTTIVRSKLRGLDTTPEFDKRLKLAVEHLYNMRNPSNFGNSRDMETMAGDIDALYRKLHKGCGPLDVDCIPERYLGSFREITPEREEEILSEMNSLVGQDRMKEQLKTILGNAKGQRKKIKRGISGNNVLNLTFLLVGNPGTGKTTVAQLLGKILYGFGLLSSDVVNIYTKDNIVSKYEGESLQNVTKMFDESFGHVLFIDKAYMLAKDEHGREVLDQITANLTHPNYKGKMAVVMAGCTDEISQIFNSNAGLSSRFQYHIKFDDYTNDQLWIILEQNLIKEGVQASKEACKPYADAYFDEKRKTSDRFGNARECCNLQQQVISNQNNRIAPFDNEDDDFLKTILPVDFPNYAELKRKIELERGDITLPVEECQTPDSTEQSKNIMIDCTSNQVENRVKSIKDVDYAVGLLHSSAGEGTAFIISLEQKYILTCSHVIDSIPLNERLEFKLGSFSTQAHRLWNDYSSDMALLMIDNLPDNACYFELDSNIDTDPERLTKVFMCGYPDGSEFASSVSVVESSINNYEKNHRWNDRQYDTIYSNLSATHGCSGGPVLRQEDMVVVGLLQGGIEGREIQLITDIHQLFRKIKIITR